MKKLIEKYGKNHCNMMGNFTFEYKELSFEIMQDFNTWQMVAMEDGEDQIITFYQED